MLSLDAQGIRRSKISVCSPQDNSLPLSEILTGLLSLIFCISLSGRFTIHVMCGVCVCVCVCLSVYLCEQRVQHLCLQLKRNQKLDSTPYQICQLALSSNSVLSIDNFPLSAKLVNYWESLCFARSSLDVDLFDNSQRPILWRKLATAVRYTCIYFHTELSVQNTWYLRAVNVIMEWKLGFTSGSNSK